MAIDSAEKRKSLAGILPFLPVGVTPNASKDQEWRQEAGWGYPGILSGNVLAAGDLGWLEYTMPGERLHFTMPGERCHFTMPGERLHFTMQDEDQ